MRSRSEVTVRAVRAADADDVLRLLRAFTTSHVPDPGRFRTVAFPAVLASAAAGRAEFLAAEMGGRVVGYAYAVRVPTLFAGGTVLELLELTVDAELRGRGLGSRLVRAVLEAAGRAADAEVCVPTRRAADFYRRLGFAETATYLKRTPRG
ncbi:GNAT family N-acetyltransferase [Streptomyces griseorubiginosus]|uniref:GNAT family N-acetyltransferase n=1 Tax=Streptomyces griseorubiginosus TaxID=67304 RepID=UPI00114015DA|nr:GNAT family N-acetyltransferase [Streptomyces griseorubiginosus]